MTADTYTNLIQSTHWFIYVEILQKLNVQVFHLFSLTMSENFELNLDTCIYSNVRIILENLKTIL